MYQTNAIKVQPYCGCPMCQLWYPAQVGTGTIELPNPPAFVCDCLPVQFTCRIPSVLVRHCLPVYKNHRNAPPEL